jgi:PAS domain S-box-containing protein
MNKKIKIVILIVVLVAASRVITISIINEIRDDISTNLVTDYQKHEEALGEQVARIVETQIENIREKLLIIADNDAIKSTDPEVCNPEITQLHSILDSKIGNLGRVGLDKKFYCTINPALIGSDATRLGTYINEIFEDPEHNPVTSRIILAPGAGYAIAVHVPVYDSNGDFAGTIGGAIYLAELNETYLKHVSIGDTGYVILLDDDGTLLFHPQSELIGKNFFTDEDIKKTITNIDEVSASIQTATDQGIATTLQYNFMGSQKQATFVPIQIAEDRHWIVGVTLSVDEIQDDLVAIGVEDNFYKVTFVTGFFAALVPFLILIYLILRVFNVLSRINGSLNKITQGDFSERIRLRGPKRDELVILSDSFDKMADELQSFNEDMQAKVQSKTEQLSDKVAELEKTKIATLNILEDLAEEKENLKEEKDKIDTIIKSIGDAVFVVDKDLKIMLYNAVAAQISGFSAEEAVGKNYKDVLKFISEDTNKESDSFVMDALNKGVIAAMANHTVIVTKDGNKIPVSDSAAPIKNKDGIVIGCVVVFRDVSREREVDRAKTEFVSLASHQLRTPLSAISWYAEMLMDGDAGKLNKQQMEFLSEIYQGNKRMVALVNALLNVSRIDLGTFAVEPTPTKIVEIAESVIKELQSQIETKEQKLVTDFDELPEMQLDVNLARIIFQNLISNAVKYTPEKGTVTVKVKKDSDKVVITVADTGYGIPKEQQERIFQKLFRADNVREKEADGTGLGLYIVKAILDNSGGDIKFVSEENKGTTFTATLPITGMAKKDGTKGLS